MSQVNDIYPHRYSVRHTDAVVTRPGNRGVYPPVVGMSDEAIARRARAGDTAAFAELVARYRDRLGRYALHMLGNREDAEEALQDSFVRAFRSLYRYDDRAPFGPWLFTILVNRCRTVGRRTSRRERLFVQDDVTLNESPAPERVEATEWDETIRRALDRLAPAAREAFLLKYVEELEYEEMARLTGVGVSALKMRVKRAAEQLRTFLTEVEHV